tara:strand:- start:243 stop:1478 length:1236 start_codon:yes stop_codon:yes gene_type:complete
MITITYLSGPNQGQTASHGNMDLKIGRGNNNQIIFDGQEYKTVSREHCSIAYDDGFAGDFGECYWITDHSTNGTYVNGEKLSNEKKKLNNGDIISFSHERQDLRISIQNEVKDPIEKKVDTNETSASYTKIVPTTNPGFLKEVTDQTFFMPALITIIAGVFLFWALKSSFTVYTNVLGIYIGLMTIFFIRSISGMYIPLWLMVGTTITSVLLFYMIIPWVLLELIFRPPQIMVLLDSNIYFESFIGHFIAAGLHEELFKAIPVFAFILLKEKFKRLDMPGFKNGKVSPVLTVLIGVSSAVGFIFHETLYDYVPKYANEYGEVVGLAILIPRFISGIAGHVGFSGIFSYYIGLSFYYKRFDPKLLLIGWVLSSLLHGLWNSSPNMIVSLFVAITTFTIFMIYFLKAKKSFPT